MRKNYNLSFGIIIISIIVYLITRFIYQDLNIYLGLHPVLLIKYKHFWSLITHMFAHGDLNHLFFNMFAIFIFGHAVESKMGSKGFIIYYLSTGLLAGVFSLVLYFLLDLNVLLVGASGAIYSLLFAYAVIYPNRKLYILGLIPISPPVLILIYTGYDLFSQIFRSTNVAHLTHLSGFLFAYLYFKIIYKVNPIYIFKNYRRYQ